MGPVGPETKNDYAGKGQGQFTTETNFIFVFVFPNLFNNPFSNNG
jgi:hypothetical protein